MALAIKADLTFDISGVTLIDQTGSYNVLSNPGGWGAPNPELTDYAHAAIIRKMNVNGIANVILLSGFGGQNPTSATQWTATRFTDGWFQGKKFDILVWTSGTNNNGDVRYYNGSVWKAHTTTTNPPNPTDWDIVSDFTTLEFTFDPTVIITTQNRNTAFSADAYWSTRIADLTEQGNLAINIDDRQKARLDLIYQTIQQVKVADKRGNNTAGEWCSLRLIRLGAK